jgi:3-methylfumaryl-CoA hydratase
VSAEIQIADDYAAWVGRSETATDVVSPQPARLLAATLDLENTEFSERDPLPPLWHWLYHLPAIRTSELGVDGHPRRGGFLPPIKLPRRMFAGGRLQFHRPICIGDIVHRTRMIGAVERKEGRAGPLYIVTVRHAFRIGDGQGPLALEEEQNIVYLGGRPEPAQTKGAAPDAPPPSVTMRKLVPNRVMLFRFSALTFNAHRIHYDQPYARGEEGYPDLVVHGPLTAMTLAQFGAQQLSGRMSRFSFRANAPIFVDEEIVLAAWPASDGYRLSARCARDGRQAMTASAQS